jgi:hypothetical protein
LVETARQAPVNGMDETGWNVGGRPQWLHVAVSAQVTVYAGWEMAQIASPAALAFPRAVEVLLADGIGIARPPCAGRDLRARTRIATGELEAKLDRMLETRRRNVANRRLARHLEHEAPWLFTFLHRPGLDATNNAAERAIRGMVIARKVWGGNRTWGGAHTQQILASVLRTCWQRGKDAFTRCVRLLRAAPRTVILDIVPGADCAAPISNACLNP